MIVKDQFQTEVSADGAPRDIIKNPAVVDAYLGQQYAQRNAIHG